MDYLYAFFLGIVQGITEFLPISSSAHLKIASAFLGIDDWGAGFTAISQIGTEICVLVYFRKKISLIIEAWFKEFKKIFHLKSDPLSPDARLGWFIIIGSIPIGICGLIFRSEILGVFRNLWIISFTLIFFGILLGVADKFLPQTKDLNQMTIKDALIYGLGQSFALIPGVSRSGGTITAGRFLKYQRESAATYAFLLALPAVLMSSLYEIYDVLTDSPENFPGFGPTVLTVFTAFIFGYLVLKLFMKIIHHHSFLPFVIYRISLGLLVIILLIIGVIPAA